MESRFNTDGQAMLSERLSMQARDVLGYSIIEGEFSCTACGRVYDDALGFCTSDDCPGAASAEREEAIDKGEVTE